MAKVNADLVEGGCLNEGQALRRLYATALHYAVQKPDSLQEIWQVFNLERDLRSMEPAAAILWHVAKDFVTQHRRGPTESEYTYGVEAIVDGVVDPPVPIADLTDEDIEFMRDTISRMWSTEVADPDVLSAMIRDHAWTQTVDQLRHDVIHEQSVPAQAVAVAEQQLNRLHFVTDFTLRADDSFMLDTTVDALIANQVCLESTRIEWLDTMTGGGHEAESVNAVVGAISSGKSTFCCQLVESFAELLERDGRPGIVLLVTYEDTLRDVRTRIQAAGTGISRSRLRREPHLLTSDQCALLGKLNRIAQRRIAVADMTEPRNALVNGSMASGIATICRRIHCPEHPIRLARPTLPTLPISRRLRRFAQRERRHENLKSTAPEKTRMVHGTLASFVNCLNSRNLRLRQLTPSSVRCLAVSVVAVIWPVC